MAKQRPPSQGSAPRPGPKSGPLHQGATEQRAAAQGVRAAEAPARVDEVKAKAKLLRELNELAVQLRELERKQTAAFEAFLAAHLQEIKDGGEALREFPDVTPSQLQNLQRREQLALSYREAEPAFQAELRRMRELAS